MDWLGQFVSGNDVQEETVLSDAWCQIESEELVRVKKSADMGHRLSISELKNPPRGSFTQKHVTIEPLLLHADETKKVCNCR